MSLYLIIFYKLNNFVGSEVKKETNTKTIKPKLNKFLKIFQKQNNNLKFCKQIFSKHGIIHNLF